MAVDVQIERRSTSGAFLIEATGGAIGSGFGLGVGIWIATVDDCPVDDLSCTLEHVGLALGLSAAGAATGSLVAGGSWRTRPSGWGAILGGLLGVPAGLGVIHLLTEDLGNVNSTFIEAASYSVTHGIVTAVFSRLGAALRE